MVYLTRPQCFFFQLFFKWLEWQERNHSGIFLKEGSNTFKTQFKSWVLPGCAQSKEMHLILCLCTDKLWAVVPIFLRLHNCRLLMNMVILIMDLFRFRSLITRGFSRKLGYHNQMHNYSRKVCLLLQLLLRKRIGNSSMIWLRCWFNTSQLWLLKIILMNRVSSY